MRKLLFALGVVIVIGLGVYALSVISQNKITITNTEKIKIVTTLFPQYDFVKAIGGDKVEVSLLLPPGVEPHSFEPKPSDIAHINAAKIFIYTGVFMEPWAHDIILSADKTVKVVDASEGIHLMEEESDHEQEEEDHHEEADGHHHEGVDPHIWLDFDYASIMAENITHALVQIDVNNASYYQNNLKEYQSKLSALDTLYKKTLATCQSKTIIYGGHYTFGYLAKRYGLSYVSAQGFSPDAEPSAKDMIQLVEQIKKEKITTIFYEELSSPKIAETLATETKTQLLLLNGAHNIPKDSIGISFISVMEENLKNLSLGLGCQL